MIKCLASERPIVRKIENLWRKENLLVKRHFCGMSVFQMIASNSAILLLIPLLIQYMRSPQTVAPATLFPTLGLILLIGRFILQHFFTALRSLSDFVSVTLKMQDFLLLDESMPREKQTEGPRVVAQDLSISWSKIPADKQNLKQMNKKESQEEVNLLDKSAEQTKAVFQNLSFELNDGDHLGVLGDKGAGKTTLLASIIGETQILKGLLCVNGTIAYVAQNPLILSDSIKNNIIFGNTMDEHRLREVIKVCELRDQVKQLPLGILTQLGVNGIKLSDSLRARISLARALYSQHDIYLIDCALDKLEIQMAQKVFQKCIIQYLRGKTVILVSNQAEHLEKIGKLLLLDDTTKPQIYQSFQDLESSAHFTRVRELLKRSRLSTEEEQKVEEFTSRQRVSIISSISDISERRMTVKGPPREVESEPEFQAQAQQYSTYFNTKGRCCAVMTLILSLLPVLLEAVLRLWLALTSSPSKLDSLLIIEIIGYFFAWMVFSIISGYSLYYITIRATSSFHDTILDRVAHSPMSFFNATPTGQILSLFTNDLDILQFSHPFYIGLLVNTAWVSVSWIFTSVFALPYLLLSLVILIVFLAILLPLTIPIITRSLYYEEKSRSELQSCIADTQSGLLTIKAYKLEDHFLSTFLSLVNSNARAILTYISFSSFLGFYTQIVSSLYAFSFFGIILAIPDVQSNTMLLSLGLTSAVLLNQYLHSFTHYVACVLSQLSKVARIMHYADLPVQRGRQYSFFAGEWPSKGHIFFHNVEVLNETTQLPILKSVSFEAQAGQKIGIIGDREAGFSTLLQTLLRIKITEPGSAIAIDGINISEVDLHTLRSSISIIPQTPFLMDGSIRENIDPYFDFTDQEIWAVLRRVDLNLKISKMQNQLNENALILTSVMNQLELQFLYLARAMLRNNRILVIDEPSGADSRALLQAVDQAQKEQKWTQLIFAQTIESIIEADSVLVLSSGEALQYAHPYNLLQESEGLFANMVNSLEPGRAQSLRAKASSRYFKSQSFTSS